MIPSLSPGTEPGKNLQSLSSRLKTPRSMAAMQRGAVTRGFVREARSKRVDGATAIPSDSTVPHVRSKIGCSAPGNEKGCPGKGASTNGRLEFGIQARF